YGALSPDGKYLAAVAVDGVSVRQVDSGDVRKIEPPPNYVWASPFPRVEWYPDQSALLLSGGRASEDSVPSIWAMPLMGGKPRRIQDGGIEAAISPDGSRIAYEHGSRGALELWCMGVHGENPHRLVPADSSGVLSVPAWSPTGRRVVYAR